VGDANRPAVLVVGVGNRARGDDGAGLEVARRVCERVRGDGFEVREVCGDPTELLEVCLGREAMVLIDAMGSGASPGTFLRFDASDDPLPGQQRDGPSSTHAVSLAETIELARAVGRLPPRVIVYTVEGRQYDAGAGLSDELAATIPTLVERVSREVDTLRASGRSGPCFSAGEIASVPDGAARRR